MLETNLFIRHKKGVSLTRAGVELFNNVKKLLEQWDEINTNIKSVDVAIKGKVTIGCHSTLAHFMMGMVARLLEEHPQLEVHFQYDFTPAIMENIVHGSLDIGLVTDPYLNSDIIFQQIAVTEFTYWISTKADTKFDLYNDDTVIICDPQLAPTQYLLKELQKKRKNTRLRLSTMNDVETIVAMTAENCGIGILPTAWTELRFKDQLKKIPDAPVYSKPLYLVYRAENKNNMPTKIVLEAIKELVMKGSSANTKQLSQNQNEVV
jgi:DNA-binding transcriptional LysR family regulator